MDMTAAGLQALTKKPSVNMQALQNQGITLPQVQPLPANTQMVGPQSFFKNQYSQTPAQFLAENQRSPQNWMDKVLAQKNIALGTMTQPATANQYSQTPAQFLIENQKSPQNWMDKALAQKNSALGMMTQPATATMPQGEQDMQNMSPDLNTFIGWMVDYLRNHYTQAGADDQNKFRQFLEYVGQNPNELQNIMSELSGGSNQPMPQSPPLQQVAAMPQAAPQQAAAPARPRRMRRVCSGGVCRMVPY